MPEQLVIRISPHVPNQAEWVIGAPTGQFGTPREGPLHEAARHVQQRRVTVLLPGSEILLTRAALPARSSAKLRQVAPYALEEHLADDVDDLHFALGRLRHTDGTLSVAAISRASMDARLEALRAAGLRPHAVVAEQDALPDAAAGISVVLTDDRAAIRFADGHALVIELPAPDDLADLLGLDDDSPPPDSVTVYLDERVHDSGAAWLDALRAKVGDLQVRLLQSGSLPLLAARAVSPHVVNLRQADYAPKTSFHKLWGPWRLAAVLLLSLAGLSMASQGVRLWSLSKHETALDERIAEGFRSVGIPQVADPVRQLDALLRNSGASGAAEPQVFLDTLNVLASVFADAASTRVENLRFRAGIIDMQVRVPDVETLDQIKRRAGADGSLDVEIQSADPVEGAVIGRMRLRKPQT